MNPVQIAAIIFGIIAIIGVILLGVGGAKKVPAVTIDNEATHNKAKKAKRNLMIAGGVMLGIGALVCIGCLIAIKRDSIDGGSDAQKYANMIVDDLKNNSFGDKSRDTCGLMISAMGNPAIVKDYNMMKLNAKEQYMTDNFCKTTAGSILNLKSLPRPTK